MHETRPTWHRRLSIEIPAEADLYEKLKAYQWNTTTEIDCLFLGEQAAMALCAQLLNQVPEMETSTTSRTV